MADQRLPCMLDRGKRTCLTETTVHTHTPPTRAAETATTDSLQAGKTWLAGGRTSTIGLCVSDGSGGWLRMTLGSMNSCGGSAGLS